MRRIIGLILVAGLIGCDSATAPDTSYVGSYTLTSINGAALFAQFSDRVEYTGGVVWLDADRTYSGYVVSQQCFVNGCTAPELKFTSNGKFTRNSSQFTLVDSATGESTLWTYSDNTLTIDDSRDFAMRSVLVFTKDAVTQPRT